MIIVHTWREGETSWVSADGHACTKGVKGERDQVCAGVSTLLVTLWVLCGGDQASAGQWGGEGSGQTRVGVPADMYHYYLFALRGLHLIAENYPGHIAFQAAE